MKRTTIHISAALALLLGIAACTQDEAGFLPEGAEGTPIVFTATGLNPTATATAGTRAPVDSNWQGVTSVAVRMDGTVKAYDVIPTATAPTSAMLTSDDPHYWTSHDNITVTAWWPYTAGETTPPAVKVAADQSARKDFEGSDLIVAEEQTVSYGNPTLRFTHRTAQITVVLTNYTEGLASVRLTGLSTENGNPAEIAPYDKGGDTYTALVAPQSVAAGTAFITCAFNNGKTFAYRMQGAAEWKAGEEYTYTVSLAAAYPGYTDDGQGNYTVTTADGLMNVAELVNGGKTDINITLDTDLDLTGKEWTPIGNYEKQYTGTFDGNGKTITGLTFNQPETNNVGLIGNLGENGMVQDVKLDKVNIKANNNVGGIVGTNKGGSIIGCSVSGDISGVRQVGGVMGWFTGNGIATACYHVGSVSGSEYVGGVAGNSSYGSLTACYHVGNVTGSQYVGGVTGIATGSLAKVIACYWNGYDGNGIGLGRGEATQVDGTTVTWQTAVDAMNAALQNAGSEWRYELTGELPTLKK